ncbi:hypothetical protein [Glycomyces sp. NPDC021274]|jgi:hypothetical protein|uniref:hypothetical protein n=1 Tax=Glycomyces sp. NPDC021274 TaxID=3155120 RepID=UPI0033E98A71
MTDNLPPHRANGAAIIAYYANRVPDEDFAEVLEAIHEEMNRPVTVEDPWETEACPPPGDPPVVIGGLRSELDFEDGVFDVDPDIQ